MAFPVNPPSVICNTLEQHPQTYQGNQGAYKHLVDSTKGGLHGAMVYSNDTKTAAAGGMLISDAFVHAGAKADQTVGQSGRAPQSVYTPIVQKMKEDGSNLGFGAVSLGGTIEWRSEAKLQGLSDDQVTWVVPSGGYDKSLRDSADTMDGTYVVMNFLPFEEARTNAMLRRLPEVRRARQGHGLLGVRLLRRSRARRMRSTMRSSKHGVNGITRSSLLAGLGTLTAFDAGGIIGKNNLAKKVSSACTMLEQFKNGRFVRVWPKKKGTFDCTPSNYIRLKEDLTG